MKSKLQTFLCSDFQNFVCPRLNLPNFGILSKLTFLFSGQGHFFKELIYLLLLFEVGEETHLNIKVVAYFQYACCVISGLNESIEINVALKTISERRQFLRLFNKVIDSLFPVNVFFNKCSIMLFVFFPVINLRDLDNTLTQT